jgi:hypothetical protein
MRLEFEKEESGKWYIVLPNWEGAKYDLEMVMGADIMLDKLSEGKNNIVLDVFEESFDNAIHLKLVKECSKNVGGGDYILEKYNGEEINLDVWLCDVTRFVFGYMPKDVYFKIV